MVGVTAGMSERLAFWLEQYKDQLLPRWQSQAPQLVERLNGQGEQLFPAFYSGVVAAARGQFDPLDLLLSEALSTAAGQNSAQFGAILQLPFQLRHVITELLQEQSVEPGDAFEMLRRVGPIVERAVLTLSRNYSSAAEAELLHKINQAEFLANQQSLLAEEADKAALQMSSMYDISRSLSGSLERDKLLVGLGSQLRKALRADRCAIWMVDHEDQQLLRLEQAWGKGWEERRGATLAAGKTPWPAKARQALELTQPQLVTVEKQQEHGPGAEKGSRLLYLPLRIPEKALGYVVIQEPTNGSFGSSELRLAQAVGNQAGIALENAYLYNGIRQFNAELERKVEERTHELKEERDRLQILYQISHFLTGTLDIDDLLNRTLDAVGSLMGVPTGSIMLVEQDTGHLVVKAVIGATEHRPGFVRFQIGEGVAGWVAQHKEAALIHDVREDPRWVPLSGISDRPTKSAGSFIGVPLLANDEIMGVLTLSYPDAHYFNEHHMQLLNAIAGEMAIAIYNAQLYSYVSERTERLGTMLRRHEEEASKTNAILQSLADAVIVCNTNGHVILANMAAERILDRPMQDLISTDTTLSTLLGGMKLPSGAGDAVEHVLAQPLLSDSSLNTVAATVMRGHRTLSVHLGPVMTERGEMLGAVAILRDITREVESDRLKTEFIATVSHELRTPMTSIKGYTQLLSLGSLGEVNATQREFLNTITQNAERMIAIINDLLDITKVETGSVDLNLQTVRLAEPLGEAVSECRLQLTERSHELGLELEPNLPPVLVDPERLEQVLTNLLSNAVKYTPRGGRITVSARHVQRAQLPPRARDEVQGQGPLVQVAIQDTGVGIDQVEQDKIFERFYRTENPLKVEAGGTGLGLALVRGLVKLLGGAIWVESEIGQGSTFTFVIPAVHVI